MKKNDLLKEAKRLHALGFAVHWLKPKSKRPVESGWTTGPRKSWDDLYRIYSEGLNVGVRLGTPSKLTHGYLCVVDVDVKSDLPHHKEEALKAARRLLGGAKCPIVSSGRGNGSRHYYCVTEAPFKPFEAAHSEETVKVHMPSAKASRREEAELSEKEIAQGLRLRCAWEVSVMSDGRQVVLPPSIHPDSGKPYFWQRNFGGEGSIPLVRFESTGPKSQSLGPVAPDGSESNEQRASDSSFEFQFAPVEIAWLDIPDKIKKGILTGEGAEDRSAFLLPAATALFNAGLSRDEILTVLTEPKTYLGQCAYDHAQTKVRARAAYWLWRYTVRKVCEERDATKAFDGVEVVPVRGLTEAEAKAQTEDFEDSGIIDWRKKLERTDARSGYRVKSTFYNIRLILEEVFGKDCIRFNEFANTEEMWGAFPWLTKPGKELHDIDIVKFKDWFVSEWDFEPAKDKLIEVLAVIGFDARYHPVKQWIEALPAWDEKPRIEKLLSKYIPCVGDDVLRETVSRRFLVALIKRIYEPGCQSDYLLVLEGLQGIQKSSAFRALVGDEWFSDATFNVEDKDAVMVIFSKWLIEFGELSTLDRATAEHTKAFITRRSDRIRAPFDRKARDYPRQCLFVGSTNKDEYLKDDTGNRRFWPFKVTGRCRVDLIQRDRDQLFAEAKYYYDIGEVTYLKEPELEAAMREQQGAREMHDVLIEQVQAAIDEYEETNERELDGFPILTLFKSPKLSGVRTDAYGTARVGAALRKLGFEQRRTRTEGVQHRAWFRKFSTPSDILKRGVTALQKSAVTQASQASHFTGHA